MGLPSADVSNVTMAAYLHDLGKMGGFHLTALNVAEYEGHRLAAQKSFSTPARLFEGVRALDAAFAPVSSMYERFDGSGFPGRLKGKDIPLGARILAIADTYADLTANARNPFRRVLEPPEAQAALLQHADKIFDGNMIELFRLAVQGDDLKQKLLQNRPVILLVEPDPEDATVLELRLVSNGFEVHLARAADIALETVTKGEVDFVISEVELKPFDGFELLRRMHADDRTRSIPFLFVARRFDTADVNRGFGLGAAEYFPKPGAPDVIAAKLRRLADQKKHSEPAVKRAGVSGSLAELALPDLVQLLAQGRKTGRLSIDSPGGRGEVQFAEGTIADAAFGTLRGEDAFYELLSVMEGDFALDPSFVPPKRVIHGSAEGLLLEGLRRLDEKNR
jgi:response regulator RpfG family c-di-GMP phosphodiesterase